MKKIISILILILFIIFTTIIQVKLFNNIFIFGVRVNFFIILTSAISLWYVIFIGGTYGLINGFILDSLYEQNYGKYIILYTIIAVIVGSMNHLYKRENKVTLMYVVATMTILFEIIELIISIVISQTFPGIFTIFKVVLVSTILNTLVSSLAYYIFVLISYKLDEVFIVENRW